MVSWANVLVGLLIGFLTGVAATLVAGNPSFVFGVEKTVRRLLRRPLVGASLRTFWTSCEDGMVLVHCIEVRTNLWLTSTIPKVYFLSYGPFPGNSYAYKPFLYFCEDGLKCYRGGITLAQLLEEYGNSVIPHAPDDSRTILDISKSVPINVVAICETVDLDSTRDKPLNHVRIVGKLYAAVRNPMPSVSSGANWVISIISQEFGFIDSILVGIPANLEEQEPLGSLSDVMRTEKRPPCLLDVGGFPFTWPLRLLILDNRFKQSSTKSLRKRQPALVPPL